MSMWPLLDFFRKGPLQCQGRAAGSLEVSPEASSTLQFLNLGPLGASYFLLGGVGQVVPWTVEYPGTYLAPSPQIAPGPPLLTDAQLWQPKMSREIGKYSWETKWPLLRTTALASGLRVEVLCVTSRTEHFTVNVRLSIVLILPLFLSLSLILCLYLLSLHLSLSFPLSAVATGKVWHCGCSVQDSWVPGPGVVWQSSQLTFDEYCTMSEEYPLL